MGQGIESDQVGGTEGGALRPGSDRAGHRINLLDGHAEIHHVLDALVNRIDPDAVGDEVDRILAVDNALAGPVAEEFGHVLDHLGVGLPAGHNLHQPHIARRIEEMGDQETPFEVIGQDLGHLVDRQAAGVGAEDRGGGDVRGDLLQQLELDRHVLDHHLDDPVAGRQLGQVILEVADLDQVDVFRQVERRRFHLDQSLEAALGDAVADRRALQGQPFGRLLLVQFPGDDVEHQDLDSRIGQMGGNGGAHDAGAQHRCSIYLPHCSSPCVDFG